MNEKQYLAEGNSVNEKLLQYLSNVDHVSRDLVSSSPHITRVISPPEVFNQGTTTGSERESYARGMPGACIE